MVIATIRPKYACPTCQEGVHQAPAPAHLIEGGLPTEATPLAILGAHVLVGKFADHLPLYRQAQIYRRQGIELDRSTMIRQETDHPIFGKDAVRRPRRGRLGRQDGL